MRADVREAIQRLEAAWHGRRDDKGDFWMGNCPVCRTLNGGEPPLAFGETDDGAFRANCWNVECDATAVEVLAALGLPVDAANGAAPAADPPTLRIVPVEEFVAVVEHSAEPLLGDEGNAVLPAGGTLVFYGTGGGGKTTLEVDLVVNLAAGLDWLGLPVPRRCRVLLVENEGPRNEFRRKLEAKLAVWDGPSVDGYLHVLEEPWARFTLADEAMRRGLAAFVAEHEIDVVAAGPVQRLGIEGGGTPAEVIAFATLIEEVRAELERPLGAVLVHHDNKAGTVSGAWEGVPDTLAHVRALGHGATRVEWEKVRWGSELHGRAWKLLWREGEGFELDEAPEVTDEDIRAGILAVVAAHPGCSWNAVEGDAGITGKTDRKREIRDALLDEGQLVNLGGGKGGVGGGGMKLYLASDVPEQGAFAPDGANGGANGSPPPQEGPFAPRPDVRKGRGGRTGHEGHTDNWCPRCERVLEAAYAGQPRCHCADPDRGMS